MSVDLKPIRATIMFRVLFLALLANLTHCKLCEDHAVNCEPEYKLCNVPLYLDLMMEYCPLTCGFCRKGQTYYPPITATPIGRGASVINSLTCVDAYSSCTSWARNGFCDNKFYSLQTRKEYCAFTCSLC